MKFFFPFFGNVKQLILSADIVFSDCETFNTLKIKPTQKSLNFSLFLGHKNLHNNHNRKACLRTLEDSTRVSVVHDVQNVSVVLPPAVVLCYKEKKNVSMKTRHGFKFRSAQSSAEFSVLPKRAR